MGVEIVLAALEEYFSIKRDVPDENDSMLDGAKSRAIRALNAYIDLRFNTMMLEEKRKVSTITKKMKAVNPETKVSWDGVAAAIDALNSPPQPPVNTNDRAAMERWSGIYNEWYRKTRSKALASVLPPSQEESIELDMKDFEE